MEYVINLDRQFDPLRAGGSNTMFVINFEDFTFPAGEEHIRLDEINGANRHATITTRLNSSSDIMKLLLATDALRRHGFEYISAFIPYIPYARQDRVCNPGEALSIGVMADLLNEQWYDKVFMLDPHSDVAPALIDDSVMISMDPFYKIIIEELGLREFACLVSPDAGAEKKINHIAAMLMNGPCSNVNIVKAGKIRDTKTGKIYATDVYATNTYLEGKTCVVIDDICDGGKTFIELGKALRAKGAKQLILAVTHGIFSKTPEPIFEIFDKIYTTDSINNHDQYRVENFRVIPVKYIYYGV